MPVGERNACSDWTLGVHDRTVMPSDSPGGSHGSATRSLSCFVDPNPKNELLVRDPESPVVDRVAFLGAWPVKMADGGTRGRLLYFFTRKNADMATTMRKQTPPTVAPIMTVLLAPFLAFPARRRLATPMVLWVGSFAAVKTI